MPLNRPRRFLQRLSYIDTISAPIIALVICRKFWLSVVTLMCATLAVCGLSVSGCSFGEDNVGSIGNAAAPAPASTPQNTGINEN
jgi:hypothetical protein